MQTTKPFFLALETVLKTRLPADAFAQVMEESLWEFEADAGDAEGVKVRAANLRFPSICLSFYRAMTKMGMSAESALETIARAGESLRWPTEPASGSPCSVAAYFRAKGALHLCRTVFCRSCLHSGNACGQADPETHDWTASQIGN
ncbi:MAG: hypothetical protein JF616_16185 [Fibrobacteres bacterium]|nr:hypothetical protein [Fibrobacterota bacterium]